MEDYKIVLGALLDANAKGDIDKQLNAIKDLSVTISKATLSNDVINDIKRQLAQNGIDINLVFGNTSQITNQAKQTGQQIGQQISQSISSAIQKGTMANLKEFKFSGKLLQNDVAKKALEDFKALGVGIVIVKEEMKNIDGKNLLNGFTINIKNAKGEVESLRYALTDIEGKTGKMFQYVGGSINDNGVIRQMNTISAKADSLQTKLEKLKSSYSDMNASRPIKDSNNISALSQQYDKVSKSIENVRNADSASFSSMVSNAQREITVLENMVSQFRNAENVATQMKSVDISSGIAQAQERLGKLKANASGFEQMKQTIVDLDTAIANVGDKSSLDAFINKLKVAESQLGRVKAETKQLQDVNKIHLSFAKGDYEAKVESAIAKTQQWRDENGNARISTEQLRTAFANLGTAYNNLNADGGNTVENQKALKQAESELSAEIKKATNEVTKMNAEYAKSSKVESFHQKLTEFYDKNSATHRKWGAELKQMMDATANGAKVTNSELLRMELRYKEIGNEARQAGKLGLSLFDGIKEQAKKFTQWVSITSVVMKSVQAVHGAVDNVIELDDALLELSKVSDLSAEGLENVTNQAYELGEKVGKTGTQVLDAITTFKRAGFDITQSTYLAEDALKMTNVAEGINDAADSAQYLISIMKGYKDTSDEFATKILDSINEVDILLAS